MQVACLCEVPGHHWVELHKRMQTFILELAFKIGLKSGGGGRESGRRIYLFRALGGIFFRQKFQPCCSYGVEPSNDILENKDLITVMTGIGMREAAQISSDNKMDSYERKRYLGFFPCIHVLLQCCHTSRSPLTPNL